MTLVDAAVDLGTAIIRDGVLVRIPIVTRNASAMDSGTAFLRGVALERIALVTDIDAALELDTAIIPEDAFGANSDRDAY